MTEEDPDAAGVESAGGVDVFAVARGHDLGADKTRISGPPADGEGENQISKSRTEKYNEGDGQLDAWQGERRICRESGESSVDPSPEVACEAAWRSEAVIRILVTLLFVLHRRYSESALSDPSFKS